MLPVVTSSPDVARALEAEPGLSVELLDDAGASSTLLTGKAVLFAQPSHDGGVVFRYDDTNPDGRAARLLADRAVQRAAGRIDPTPARDESGPRAGEPVCRLRRPRTGGPRHHEQRTLGARVLDRRFAPPPPHETARRDADVADAVPALVSLLAHDGSRPRSRRADRVRRHRLRRSGSRAPRSTSLSSASSLRSHSARSGCCSRRARARSKRCRA